MGGNNAGYHPLAAGKLYEMGPCGRGLTDDATGAGGVCATLISDAFMNPFDGEQGSPSFKT